MKYRQFLSYSRQIRYVVFFLTLILMIVSVKVYLNDFNIEKSIAEEMSHEDQIKQQDNFEKNYYIRFLSSPESQMFIAHDNFIARDGEKILKFTAPEIKQANSQVVKEEMQDQEKIINISDPKDAWNYFLGKKYEKFKLFLNQ